jgi:hypothetical protein
MWNACRRRCFLAFINTMVCETSPLGAPPAGRADSEILVSVDCRNETLGVHVFNVMVNVSILEIEVLQKSVTCGHFRRFSCQLEVTLQMLI